MVDKGTSFKFGKEFYEKDESYLKLIDDPSKYQDWFSDYTNAIFSNSHISDKILELGSGTGISGSLIIKKRKNFTGSDFSKTFVKLAQKRNGKKFIQIDATKIPFKDSSFDLVCSADLIEHIPNLSKALDEMERVLKRNGTLVIQFPNLFSNVFSFNYQKSVKTILRKFKHLFIDFFNPQLRTIKKYSYALDVYEADKDAYNLLSPTWVKKELLERGYKIIELNSYSYPFKSNLLIGLTLSILRIIPIIKYAGGRVILIAKKVK